MRLGLRQKLVVLVLVILVPLLALLAFNVFRFFAHLEDDQLTFHTRDARIVSASLDRFVHDLVQVAQAAGLAIAQNRIPPRAASTYLATLRNHMPVSNIAYIDPSGKVLASAIPSLVGSNVAGLPGFRSVVAGEDFAVSDLRRNASGRLGFVVFTGVKQGGALVAVSAIAVDARDLATVIPGSITGSVILVTDRSGGLVFSNRPELEDMTQQQRRDWESPGVRTALGGKEFTTRSTRIPGLPGTWLGSEVPAQTGWTVGLFDSSGTALAFVANEVWLNLAAIVVVLAVSLLAARQYGHSIAEPIEKLTDATAQLRQGRFDTYVPVTTNDEIGELAANFRQMQESLKRTFGDVQLLAESARWMSSTLDLEAVAHATEDYLGRVLDARAVVITLFGAGRPEAMRRLAPRLSAEAAGALGEAGAAAVGRADLERRGQAVVEIEVPPALAEAAPGASTLVALPLVVNRELIGRLDALVPPRHSGEFEQADVPLAASLAQQVAAAVANARLFEEQRAIADTLQDALLTKPYRIPEFDIGLVYHQATVGGRIGGDFYDFIPIDPHRTAVVVGDITGKGLDAARYTTIGKGAIRAFALEDPRPSVVLARAGRVISEQLGAENFITAVFLLLDLEDGCFEYAVAGHPPPVLFRRAARETDLLGVGGMPLGVDASETYEQTKVCMEVGDRLMLYTDGLSEARRGTELFGFERVSGALRGFAGATVRDTAVGTAEAAISFAGGALGDDLAIIVLERCPVPVAAAGAGRPRSSARRQSHGT